MLSLKYDLERSSTDVDIQQSRTCEGTHGGTNPRSEGVARPGGRRGPLSVDRPEKPPDQTLLPPVRSGRLQQLRVGEPMRTDIHEAVREHYAAAANGVLCGEACC